MAKGQFETTMDEERLRKALKAFGVRGIYADAARAAGVHNRTLKRWRRDPEVQDRFNEVAGSVVERIGRKYIAAIERHVDDVLAGKTKPDRYAVAQKTGTTVLVQKGEPLTLNTHLVTLALRRYEPAWVEVQELSDRIEAMEAWMHEVIRLRSPDTPPAPVLTLHDANEDGDEHDAT